jgi:ABC-type xylose transport system permease subunit
LATPTFQGISMAALVLTTAASAATASAGTFVSGLAVMAAATVGGMIDQ